MYTADVWFIKFESDKEFQHTVWWLRDLGRSYDEKIYPILIRCLAEFPLIAIADYYWDYAHWIYAMDLYLVTA